MLTTRAPTAVLRIDGVRHQLGDAAVLPQPEPIPGGLRWSLELRGPEAARLARVAAPTPAGPSRRPTRAAAARLLDGLRILFLRTGTSRPRFALTTIDSVEAGPTSVRLGGTCSPVVSGAFEPPRSAV